MTLVVDIRHWLTEDGDLPEDNLHLRRNALRIARLVEYGADLAPRNARETLIECRRRQKGRQCLGLLWVQKRPDERIEAYCIICGHVEAVISGWQDTPWSDGIMPPLPPPATE